MEYLKIGRLIASVQLGWEIPERAMEVKGSLDDIFCASTSLGKIYLTFFFVQCVTCSRLG